MPDGEDRVWASMDRADVTARERHLVLEWLPMAGLAGADVRPVAVRDVLAAGRHDEVRHLLVDVRPTPV